MNNYDKLTMEELIKGMAYHFNPNAAKNLNGDLQFIFIGEEETSYFLRIDHESCTFHKGVSPCPCITITSPCDVWKKISSGELDGATALMTGQYTANGDMRYLLKMNQLFHSDSFE